MAASLKCLRKFGVLPCFSQNVMQCVPHLLRGKSMNIVPVVYMSTKKHYDPKFRKWRRLKFDIRPIRLHEKQERYEKMTQDEMRMERKKRGDYPPVMFQENNLTIASTSAIIDEYVPPEGDGKKSFLSKQVVSQTKDWTKWKAKNVRDKRILKKWEGSFDKKTIAFELQDIYIEAQKLLQDFKNNKDKLFDYVTEFAYPNMVFGLENKSMRWEFVESIEPPKVLQIRIQPMLTKTNYYSQLTVRMHTRQKLAIYDRFGRIMYGSEHLIKDVLEYVIFEKHIVNEYGRWRVHGKIVPTWLPVREPLITTIRKPKSKDSDGSKEPDSGVVVKEKKMEEIGGGGGSGTPQLATA